MSNRLQVGYRLSFALLLEDLEHFQGPGGSRPRILLKSQPPSRKGKSYKKMQYNKNVSML